MATPPEELEAKVLKLPAAERSHLLDKLLASLDQDHSIEDAWPTEAKRRCPSSACSTVDRTTRRS